MQQTSNYWSKKIMSHAEICRASRSIPARVALSGPQAAQLQIIKDSLLVFTDNLYRQAAPDTVHAEYTMSTVFTSTCSGLNAAEEVQREKGFPLVFLYPEEFNDFLLIFPDTEFRYHKHIWSYFVEEPDKETTNLARRFPLDNNERYWLHVEGIMLGQKFGRGAENLWSWDGSQAKLLRKNLRQWVS